MKLTGDKVILRPVQPSDFPHIVAWTNNEQVGHFAEDDGYPEDLQQCEEWYKRLLANRHNQVFVITIDNDHPIGDIEFDHITWRSGDAEMRIRIGEPEFWGKGYGTDSVRTLVRYGFEQINLQRVYLRVSRSNARAVRCYEKSHFRKEGKLMRTVGDSESPQVVYLMRILRDEYLRKYRKQTDELVG